jgi:hypothetical protein
MVGALCAKGEADKGKARAFPLVDPQGATQKPVLSM